MTLALTPQVGAVPGHCASDVQVQVGGVVVASQVEPLPQSASLEHLSGATACICFGHELAPSPQPHRQDPNSSVNWHLPAWPGQTVSLAQPGTPHHGCGCEKPLGGVVSTLAVGRIWIPTLKPSTWLTS